jgi:hypothetical protein
LCVCDKAPISERVFSLAERPLRPPDAVSRRQRKLLLSISYNRFGWRDSLVAERSLGVGASELLWVGEAIAGSCPSPATNAIAGEMHAFRVKQGH